MVKNDFIKNTRALHAGSAQTVRRLVS